MSKNKRVLFTEEAKESIHINSLRSGFDKNYIVMQFGEEKEDELLIVSNIAFPVRSLHKIIDHLNNVCDRYVQEYGEIDDKNKE